MSAIKNMVQGIRVPAALAGLVLVTGCSSTWVLDDLKATEPKGSEFNQFLAEEYEQIAQLESYDRDHWSTARYLAEKGLKAAKGGMVLPEHAENWNLNPDQMVAVKDSREKLMNAFAEGFREEEPARAACAQASFDHWVLLMDGSRLSDPADVQDAQITEAYDRFVECLEGTPMAQEKTYIVYFAFDRANLDADAQATVQSVAQDIVANGVSQVSIVGHTDTVGSQDYNLRLGMRRANAVRDAMVALGVDPAMIAATSVGKLDLAVQTGDGVREAWNRRAVITLR